ncbi:Membrane-bound lytic murein transglycosylase D precursor [hydrothermal vent metagenome]|uniref:Membrane-bound lytic murein transglycosylase D n=1 Tax=hydrothermal vent metagenome TaxID=652676 RepID=A0A1W1CGJ8_9ZZZZ
MKFYKILILFLLLTLSLYSDITRDFPSYQYVFNELGVDESYIYDRDFQNFVRQNRQIYTKRFKNAVNRGALVIPTMRELMYEKDISPLFIYLSMVESAFKTTAKSTSAAGGLWQFMPTAGREQHLRIDSLIDERYDPIKSTRAAVDYLYKIRGGLDKWYLAAMAYNCGQGCMQRAVAKAGTTHLSILLDPRRNYLRAETRKYIKKILLFALIGENYLFKYNDNLGAMIYRFDNDRITSVRLHTAERLNQIASRLQINYFTLKKINMHLKQDYIPRNSNAMLNIPTSRLNMFYRVYGGQRYSRN